MFIELIRNRRSIRKFKNQRVEKEKLDLIIEAMLRAPSSRGLNPWEFVILDDPDLLTRFSESKPHGSSFLKNAPLAIVVCGDNTVDTWVEDCSIACTFLKLAAESVGLRSCWIQIRDRNHDETTSARDFIAKTLNIPEHLNIQAIIAVGYPSEEKPGHPREKLHYHKVKCNDYNKQY